MASRQIAIRITIDNREAVNAARAQEIAMRALNAETDKHTQLQNGLTNSFIKGNLAARAISVTYNILKNAFQDVIKSAAEFEFTMAKVQAISGDGDSSIKSLSNTIKDLALSSNKSAVEIAKAALEMNKIGLTNPQVRLLLGSVVALSTALDEDLVKSGETVVNILNAYGDSVLLGKKRTEELAFTVGASALNMESFGTAFAYVGATAKLAGVKFEDLTAAMDVLSNAGIRASTIGTQLRRIIADLSDENSKASKAVGGTIESLGGLIPTMEKLRQVTPKGDEGVAFLTEKFGRTATSVAAILALNTEEMKKLSEATEGSVGNLDRMQGIMNDTFLAKWEHFANITKSLGTGPMGILKAGLSGVNDALDGMVQAFEAAAKANHDFLTAAETKNSLAKGGGFGDLLVGDQAKLKEQLAAVDSLMKKKQEMEGESNSTTKGADDTLDRIKTDFEVYKTFGGKFDFSNANKQLTELANNLMKVGEAKEAVKVMRELRAIQNEDKKKEFSPQFRSAIRKEFQDSDFTKEVQKAISPKHTKKDAEETRKAQDSANKFILEQTKDSTGETSKKAKLAILEIEQKEKLEVFKKYGLSTTEFEKAQQLERTEYSKRLNREEFQTKVALAGQYVGAASAATMALAKNYKSFHVLAKTAAIAEVAMNTAVSVSKVWGQTGIYGIIAQAAPIAMGLTQAAIISQQKLATGGDQIVRTPTLFMAGEAGAERVRVTPRTKMGDESSGGGGPTFIIQGDVYDYDKFQRKVKMAQGSHKGAFV